VCELIEDGVAGWLVPPEKIDALAAATQAALSDPEEARRRGVAAQQRAATRFGVEMMVAAWESILAGEHALLC
jgi:glycosyltransferase involved in cell wall biosynthesis